MKFVYIGDQNSHEESPNEVVCFGHKFVKDGEPVEVSGMAELKLANNSHFRKAEQEDPAPVKKLAPPKRSKKMDWNSY